MWTVSPCHWRHAAVFCLHEALRLHWWNSSWWTLQYRPGELTRWRICDNVNEGSCCCGGGGGRSRLWIRSFGSRRVSELAAVDVRDVGYKWGQGPLYIYKINIDVYHKHSSLNAMNMANTFSECSLAFKTWMIWPSPTLCSVHRCIDTCAQHLEVADESSQSNTWQADNNTCRKVLPDTRMSQKPGGKPFHQLTRRRRVCELRLRVFLPTDYL